MTHPASSPDGEPLDRKRLQTLRELQEATGHDFLGEVIDLFCTDTPARLAGLREALAGGDLEKIEQLAHSLKGSSSNVGAVQIEALARQIEERAARGSAGGVSELLDVADGEYQRARDALADEKAS